MQHSCPDGDHNNSYMSIYDDSRFPVAIQKYNVKTLGGQFAEVAGGHGRLRRKDHRNPTRLCPPSIAV